MRLALFGVAAWALTSTSAQAFCPSYTLSSANNSHNCGVEAAKGTNPLPAEWQSIFAVVGAGPSVWGNRGPAVADLGQGCGKPEAEHAVPARFPCEILKGLAMQESGWQQFCVPDTPADQVGGVSRTIISFDCGYGVGQVTSGMHTGETPAFDRQRVANDPTYNLATGTQILASKWKVTPCVGDNQPSMVEDWYTAVWAYNGLAYINNPSNPVYDSNRGVWNPKLGGAAPYQEKVLGWIEHPPGNPPYWPALAVAYPNPGDVGGAGSPPVLPEPNCASPTNCASKRSVHGSECLKTPSADAGADSEAATSPIDAAVMSIDASIDVAMAPLPHDAENARDESRLDAGVEATSDGPLGGEGSSGGVEGGCGCRLTRSPSGASSAAMLSIVALFSLRGRRATCRRGPRGPRGPRGARRCAVRRCTVCSR